MIRFNNYQYIAQLDDVLTEEDINKIEEIVSQSETTEGKIHRIPGTEDDPDPRVSKISWIEPSSNNNWLYQKIHDVVYYLNDLYYHFDLEGVEVLQYTTYNAPDGRYGPHIDYNPTSIVHRKISLTIQLSDENDYEGGDVLVYPSTPTNPFKLSRKKGSVSSFLSHMIHEVTPVTKGTRKSLVVWVAGPPLK